MQNPHVQSTGAALRDGVVELFFGRRYTFHSHCGGELDNGIRVIIPMGHVGILSESLFCFKNGLCLGSKLIHPGFDGELQLYIRNMKDVDVEVKEGESLGNLVIVKLVETTLS